MSPRFAFTPLPPSRSDLRKPSEVTALAGTWRGELVDEAGRREAFTLLRDGSNDSAVTGRFLFFVTRDVAPTGIKLLEASNAAFVALVGPFYDPREDAEMIAVLEGRREGTTIEGTFHTQVSGTREVVRTGTFRATRQDQANRAA